MARPSRANCNGMRVSGGTRPQARWEALALLNAVAQWHAVILEHTCGVHFVGDAQGVLQGMTALRARGPGVNVVAMEVALRLAPAGLLLAATHLWSECNVTADRLSRIAEGASLTAALAAARFEPPVAPTWRVVGQVAVAAPRRPRSERE